MTHQFLLAATILVALAGRTTTPARGQQSGSSAPTPAQTYFTDVLLMNQDNQRMRLYSDLMKGKTVIINSFYIANQQRVPLMNLNLKKVQQALGGRMGKDVYILSITIDPTMDTPARLKECAQTLGAGPGWYFLTGDTQHVEFALRKFGLYVETQQDLLNTISIGNDRTGLWKKALGVGSSDALMAVVKSVVND